MENQTFEQLTLSDLETVHTLLNLASERGAFRAAELSTVGAIYDRLSRFLASVSQQMADAAAAAETAESDEESDSESTGE